MVKAFINDVLKYSLVTQKQLRASKEETQEESKINNNFIRLFKDQNCMKRGLICNETQNLQNQYSAKLTLNLKKSQNLYISG